MSSHLYSEPQPRLLYSAARNQTTQLCIYCESTRVSVAHTLYIEQPQRRALYSYGKNIYKILLMSRKMSQLGQKLCFNMQYAQTR